MASTGASTARVLACVAALLLAAPGHCAPGAGQAVQGALAVTATVPRHASMRMAAPASLIVSDDDLARGYVEVPTPVELTVRSNVQEGYALMFECRGAQVREAQVHGPDGALRVGGAAVIATRPASGSGMWFDRVQLRLRFELTDGATAGEHPWPLRISLMPQ